MSETFCIIKFFYFKGYNILGRYYHKLWSMSWLCIISSREIKWILFDWYARNFSTRLCVLYLNEYLSKSYNISGNFNRIRIYFWICTEFYLLWRKIMYISNNNYWIVYYMKHTSLRLLCIIPYWVFTEFFYKNISYKWSFFIFI